MMRLSSFLSAPLLLTIPIIASPTPENPKALQKRDDCAIYSPGITLTTGSDSFFKSCPGGINWALQRSDAIFVM